MDYKVEFGALAASCDVKDVGAKLMDTWFPLRIGLLQRKHAWVLTPDLELESVALLIRG